MKGEDIVCSLWRHRAGIIAYRDYVANNLDNRFDGDAVGVTLSIDKYVANNLRHLAPHKNTFDLKEHRGVSGNLSIPKPVISTIANFLDDD